MIHLIARLLYQSSSIWLSPMSPVYLVSGSWPPKHCQGWVLSHGEALNPIRCWLVTPIGFGPLLYQCTLQAGLHCILKGLQLYLCVTVPFGSMLILPSTINSSLQRGNLQVGTSSTSPCLMSHVGVAFSNRASLSVCGEQPKQPSQQLELIGAFPLWLTTQLDVTDSPNQKLLW